MTRALAIAAAALAAAGCTRARTEAVVSIDVYGLAVGTDLDLVELELSDDGPGAPAQNLFSADAPLCRPGDSGACYALPLTVTVLPGPAQPHDVVRLDVRAMLGGQLVLAEAERFSFVDGAREDVKVVLYARCLNSDCASLGEACGPDGRCLAPPDMGAPPPADAGPPEDLAVPDLSSPLDLAGIDLAGVDLSTGPPDLSPPPDLGSCCPPCIGNAICCPGCYCSIKCNLPPN